MVDVSVQGKLPFIFLLDPSREVFELKTSGLRENALNQLRCIQFQYIINITCNKVQFDFFSFLIRL